jgi:hypothetical protein
MENIILIRCGYCNINNRIVDPQGLLTCACCGSILRDEDEKNIDEMFEDLVITKRDNIFGDMESPLSVKRKHDDSLYTSYREIQSDEKNKKGKK